MQRVICFIALAVFWITQVASAQESTTPKDPNAPWSLGALSSATKAASGAKDMGMEEIADQAMAQQGPTDPNLCAIVVLPGPAVSVTISFGGLQCD
jgi:hypothetical protein